MHFANVFEFSICCRKHIYYLLWFSSKRFSHRQIIKNEKENFKKEFSQKEE
jgi:hypothetical protein